MGVPAWLHLRNNIQYITYASATILCGFLFDRNDRLYWVDTLLDQIGHIDIEGSDRKTFTNIGQITQPYSLTIYTG